MCMQSTLHVHAKSVARACKVLCIVYRSVHSNNIKRSSAARNVMLRAALYVFLYYLIIFLRCNFVRHRNEAENV